MVEKHKQRVLIIENNKPLKKTKWMPHTEFVFLLTYQ